ncbi:hypothetical protein CANINC_003951 [Pichia inconspicua]|uniref:Autophagy-related protein 11 n=1 Tax=Pichia inconspicua TaxID=52247 RepID=A0A4T0WXE0_9ASCO|nr:hypothetical protein CANINC_003951 [[Candida] inconspicua]
MNNSIYSTRNGIIPVSMTSAMKFNESTTDPSQVSQTNQLTVISAFTGTKITISKDLLLTMESLKLLLAQNFKIDMDRLFLLTPFGIKLKFSMIAHDQVSTIYVFDKKFFTPSLLNPDKKDKVINDLRNSIQQEDLLNLIKPRESPIVSFHNTNFDVFMNNMSSLTPDSIINSSDLDFDGLRLLLSLIKRNSGWASALVSDMKSALFKDIYHNDYLTIEHMLNSLNALMQYIFNMHQSLQKDKSTLQNVFENLIDNSIVDKWEHSYELLKKTRVEFRDNDNKRELVLSELVDLELVREAALNFRAKKHKTEELFTKLKQLDNEVADQRDSISVDFKSYKTLYLKREWESSEGKNIEKANEIYTQLENLTTQMVNEMKDLPTFESLITTTNNMSTFISRDSIINIIKLTKIYNTQKTRYIPAVTNLADGLYKIQRKFYENREELQGKFLNSTLVSFVKLQLSLRDLTELLNSNILKNIESMQHDEFQLTLVRDLPLVFGIWMIALVNNKKFGATMRKLSRKTNEILEMMNFVEKTERKKWLTDLIGSMGMEETSLSFLTDLKNRELFLNSHIYKISFSTEEALKEEELVRPRMEPKRYNSDTIRYLSPFNKLLQNINSFPIKARVDQISQNMNRELESTNSSPVIKALIDNITLKHVSDYINWLQSQNYDSDSIAKLKQFLNNTGIQMISDNIEKNHLSGNLDNIGNFNIEDEHYMRLYRNFIESFKINKTEIKIIKSDETNTENHSEIGIVKAYEERVKKLEGMLFEKNVELFEHKWSKPNLGNDENIDVSLKGEEEIVSGKIFGRTKITLPPEHFTQKMILIEEENKTLKLHIEELEKSKDVKQVQAFKKVIEEQEDYINKLHVIDQDNKKLIESKDQTIFQLTELIDKQNAEITKLKLDNDQLVSDIDELQNMNKDLIENMTHKEVEYLSENQQNQKEKNSLQIKIEELQDINNQFDKIICKVQDIDSLTLELLDTIAFLVSKIQDMSRHIHTNLRAICLILEMMGLLLVDNDGKLEIRRVKGLRAQKKNIAEAEFVEGKDWKDDGDKLFMEIVASAVVKKAKATADWVPMISEQSEFSNLKESGIEEDEMEKNGEGLKLQNSRMKEVISILNVLKNAESRVALVMKVLNEKELEPKYQQFIENTILSSDLVLPKIHRRFDDVESLARKLQREKVQLKGDMKNLNKTLSQRLVLRNFQKGDLVLFLRTFTVNEAQSGDGKQPWAIFNIGSPNYYLKPKNEEEKKALNNKDWFVSRLTRVTKHVVTLANKNNELENPFNLAAETVWYFVETGEEESE